MGAPGLTVTFTTGPTPVMSSSSSRVGASSHQAVGDSCTTVAPPLAACCRANVRSQTSRRTSARLKQGTQAARGSCTIAAPPLTACNTRWAQPEARIRPETLCVTK